MARKKGSVNLPVNVTTDKAQLKKDAQIAGKIYAEELSKALQQSNQKSGSNQSKTITGQLGGRVLGNFLGFGASAVTGTIIQGIKNLANETLKYEDKLKSLGAVGQLTAKQMGSMNDALSELNKETKFSIVELAGLSEQLTRMGRRGGDLEIMTRAITKLAVATGEDLNKAAKITNSTLNAFGMQASEVNKVVDQISFTMNTTAANVSYFGTAMQYAGAAAKGANVSLSVTSQLIGKLADKGFAASQAGTGMRTMFIELEKSGQSLNELMTELAESPNAYAEALELGGKRAVNQIYQMATAWEDVKNKALEASIAQGVASQTAAQREGSISSSFRRFTTGLSGSVASGVTGALQGNSSERLSQELMKMFSGESPEAKRTAVLMAMKIYYPQGHNIVLKSKMNPEVYANQVSLGMSYSQDFADRVNEIYPQSRQVTKSMTTGTAGQTTQYEYTQYFRGGAEDITNNVDFVKGKESLSYDLFKGNKDNIRSEISRVLSNSLDVEDLSREDAIALFDKASKKVMRDLGLGDMRYRDMELFSRIYNQGGLNYSVTSGNTLKSKGSYRNASQLGAGLSQLDELKAAYNAQKSETTAAKKVLSDIVSEREKLEKEVCDWISFGGASSEMQSLISQFGINCNKSSKKKSSSVVFNPANFNRGGVTLTQTTNDAYQNLVKEYNADMKLLNDQKSMNKKRFDSKEILYNEYYSNLKKNLETQKNRSKQFLSDAKPALDDILAARQVETLAFNVRMDEKIAGNKSVIKDYQDAMIDFDPKKASKEQVKKVNNLARKAEQAQGNISGLESRKASENARTKSMNQSLLRLNESSSATAQAGSEQVDPKNMTLEMSQDLINQTMSVGMEFYQSYQDKMLQATQDRVDAELAAEMSKIDKLQDANSASFDAGLISTEQYAASEEKIRKERIDAENEAGKAMFKAKQENDKKMAIASFAVKEAEMALNLAVASSTQGLAGLITYPIALAAFTGLTAASFAIQMDAINSREFIPTPYAMGGMIQGPSHAAGGVKFGTNEAEGAEFVVNSEAAMKNEASLRAMNNGNYSPSTGIGAALYKSNDNSPVSKGDINRMIVELQKPVRAYVTDKDINKSNTDRELLKQKVSYGRNNG